MEIAQIVLEYIKALIYPGILVFAVILFKKELGNLLQGKLKAQYKDLTITLERQREAISAIKSNQEIVTQKIESELSALSAEGTITDWSKLAENVRRYLGVLVKVEGYWENQIIQYLRNSKLVENEQSIIFGVTKDSDPWRQDKDEDEARTALERLLNHSVLHKGEDKKIYLHQAFR